jgi:acyl-CoA reductase-like NAD-dependent aldehyde dehydrogenase
MTTTSASAATAPIKHPDRFFIDGEWAVPSGGSFLEVLDSNTEDLYARVAAAEDTDVDRAVSSARRAFDNGSWTSLTHEERASYLRDMARHIETKSDELADIWARESGTVIGFARYGGAHGASVLNYYADLASTYPWEEPMESMVAPFGLLVREPVGVVVAIVPWNSPLPIALYKLAPALVAGCTVLLKAPPEAPGAAYILAEAAEAAGLPRGVLNVLTADRDVSELFVTDHRIDKVAFTGSTAVGRRIASIMGERIGRYTLELGGKSAAVILDDADLDTAARTLANAECMMNGQVCSSLTRLIVTSTRHDEFVERLATYFSQKKVGSSLDETTELGPLAMARQRDRVESYIARGVSEGAQLVSGGGRPEGFDRGYFIEPTVFAKVDNSYAIAQEEIFGPVLSVLPAADEADAIRIANDTIYGLNASVFTADVDRARHVAGQLRSGTVGHNDMRNDFGIAFGGFKQSGIGREGGREGLLPYLEVKTVLLDGVPERYAV